VFRQAPAREAVRAAMDAAPAIRDPARRRETQAALRKTPGPHDCDPWTVVRERRGAGGEKHLFG
jgi:hypothetical protein